MLSVVTGYACSSGSGTHCKATEQPTTSSIKSAVEGDVLLPVSGSIVTQKVSWCRMGNTIYSTYAYSLWTEGVVRHTRWSNCCNWRQLEYAICQEMKMRTNKCLNVLQTQKAVNLLCSGSHQGQGQSSTLGQYICLGVTCSLLRKHSMWKTRRTTGGCVLNWCGSFLRSLWESSSSIMYIRSLRLLFFSALLNHKCCRHVTTEVVWQIL